LLHDSGETDENIILIFGTQSGLDAMEKYDNWACDGTFKCCPEIFYQLFTIHSTAPQIFALLPNNTKVKCLSALAFVPVADVISVFELLSDDDEFPQELISYFELNYIGCERGRGVNRRINCIC